MQLVDFRAKHFQCLYDLDWVSFYGLTILIGENDGGKTATLHALRILLTNDSPQSEDFSFCPSIATDSGQEEEMTLEARFSLTDSEREVVAQYAPLVDGLLVVGKRFLIQGEREHYVVGPMPCDPKLRVDITGLTIQELRALAKELNLGVSSQTKAPYVQALRDFVSKQPHIDGEVQFPSQIKDLMPEFTMVDTAGDPESVINSVMRLAYRHELEKDHNSGMLAQLQDSISASLNQQAEGLRPFIQKYRPEVQAISFDLDINFESGFRGTRLRLEDTNSRPILLDRRGTGIQRHITLAVYEWHSDVIRKRQEEGARTLILAFDEPDTHLDYHSQRNLFDIIQDFVGSRIQVVICTHSINLINRVPVEWLNHYSLIDGGTKTKVESFSLDYGDQAEIDFFLNRLGDQVGLQNALMFYERCFLVFEGATEECAFPILFRLSTGDFPYTKGVRLVNAQDNYGAIVFAKFLHRHDRPVLFIVDEDTTRNKGVKRNLTEGSLRKAGFDVTAQVHFSSPDHFEYAFRDEVWAKALAPYSDTGEWTAERVGNLREPPQHFVNKLLSETGIQSKPELGLILAKSIACKEDIPKCILDSFQEAVRLAE